MIQIINSIFFCNNNYSIRRYSGTIAGLIGLGRGIVGGLALIFLLVIIFPAVKLDMATDWYWWGYLIVFILGVAWSHVFVWGLIIISPLQFFGWLPHIFSAIESTLAVAFLIFVFLLSTVVDAVSGERKGYHS